MVKIDGRYYTPKEALSYAIHKTEEQRIEREKQHNMIVVEMLKRADEGH